MKQNKRLLIITAVMLLTSSLLLAISVSALANSIPEDAQFTPEESIVLPKSEAPKSQADLRQEQDAIKTVSGSTVVLFGEGQFETALQARGNARTTEEEINFVINDTVQMYNKYGEIVLTNAFTLPCFSYLYDAGYIAANTHLGSPLERRGNDAVIRPKTENGIYFRDEVNDKYVYEEVVSIVVYRVEMADAHMTVGTDKEEFMMDGENWSYTLTSGAVSESDWYGPGSYVRYNRVCLLPLGGEEGDGLPVFFQSMAMTPENAGAISSEYEADYPLVMFFPDDAKITDDSIYGRTDLNVGRNGINRVNTGAHDLTINGFEFDREIMNMQVGALYPEYNADTRTALLDSAEFDIEAGMTFKELVDAYGIPYQCYAKGYCEIVDLNAPPVFHGVKDNAVMEWNDDPDGLWLFRFYSGFYVTTDGKLITVTFSRDGNYDVTEVKVEDLF